MPDTVFRKNNTRLKIHMFTLAAIGTFDSTAVSELFLAVALILGAARILGEIARAYGQPAIVGEIAAGILLGKTVLGRLSPDLYHKLFGDQLGTGADIGLQALLTVAAAMLLLVAGLEVDLKAIQRKRKATIAVSFSSMILPFVIGFVVAWFLPGMLAHDADNRLVFSLFIGVALSITALPVIAKILMDLGLQRSDMGVVVLASAVVNDLVGWIGFASVLALAGAGTGNSLWVTIGLTVGFAGLCLTLGRRLAAPFLTWVQANGGWPTGVLGTVFVFGFAAAAFTEWIGVHAIFGAFLAGVLFADTGRLRERTQQSIEDIVGAVFAPLFFASIALKVDFLSNFNLVAVIVVLVIAVTGKFVGGWVGARIAGMEKRESAAVGAGMTARGAMEIILAELALEAGIIGNELFVAIVIMSLITSIIAGPAIEAILARSGKVSCLSYLAGNAVRLPLAAANVEETIRELAQAAGVSEAAAVQALSREDEMPTGMPGGWALPHCRHPDIKTPVLAIGTCPSGIDFLATDGTEASIIVFLAIPAEAGDTQLKILSALARAFSQEQTRADILAAKSATEVKAALRLAESASHHA
ncbi:MAG: Kef-type K+ transport system membrane component KefB/mannitol [Rhodothermales bacterium]|jgi:Kef-type K+ transport system membrane component KefB/mannitol/fructose-specific phosphotransferase system IIA component (Ntr-type)